MNKKKIMLITAICGLILILLVSIFYAWDKITFRNLKILIMVGTFIWFAGIIVTNQMKKEKIN